MLNEKHANHCISCTVKECRHHSGSVDYCSLDSISVASHVEKPVDERGVDCRSFECRHNGTMC